MKIYEFVLCVGMIVAGCGELLAELPVLNESYESATAVTKGNRLVVSTGCAERSFRWTEHGFVTVDLRNIETGKSWANMESAVAADWSYPELIPVGAKAELLSLTAQPNDDEGFTTKHLEVVAEIHYPAQELTLKQTIWAYPGAEGLRQQLWAKGSASSKGSKTSNKAPWFAPVKARIFNNKKAAEILPAWESASIVAPKGLNVKLNNVDPDKRYLVGLSWHDFGNGGRKQSVEVSSVDGETRVEVVSECLLPGWMKDKKRAESKTFMLPQDANQDGSVILTVSKHGVADVCINEVWLYEYDAKGSSVILSVDAERKQQLEQSAPKGAALVAYLNANTFSEKLKKKVRKDKGGGRVDYLPVDTTSMKASAAGYYAGTQQRNKPDTPVLKQEALLSSGSCDWASLMFVEDGDDGLTLVKESHKTVQTSGVDTGVYNFGEKGVENTGWCLGVNDLSPDTYKWLWGSWVITHRAGEDDRERAVKQFDALRFPTKKARDMWIVMCTWGHSTDGDGRTYAYEDEILFEMDHVADMGIDMLLIDDGWQAIAGSSCEKYPQKHSGWYPHPGTYPTKDWRNVTAKADKLGLRLGLWAAYRISNEEMLWNWERLKPEQIKLDFANLNTHEAVDNMKMKARDFMLQSDHKCIVSWDTTEALPRYGYYLFRDYGNVHFMNRKPKTPASTLYVPWLALRDFWLLSHYQNLNKWQLVIQNPEVVEKQVGSTTSDAWQHSAAYCTATALMGTPEYMGISRHYSEAARKELRALHSQYKSVRSEIWDSTVYPIGAEPTNRSWTGFQAVHPDGKHGYLTIFRERLNSETRGRFALRILAPGAALKLTDLSRGTIENIVLGSDRNVEFEIPKAPGYLFLKYELE